MAKHVRAHFYFEKEKKTKKKNISPHKSNDL